MVDYIYQCKKCKSIFNGRREEPNIFGVANELPPEVQVCDECNSKELKRIKVDSFLTV